MDQNNELEAKTSKEEIRTTTLMDLQEVFPHLIRTSLRGQTSHMGKTIRTMEDHMINAQISNSIEAMEIEPKMDLSLSRMGPGKTVENSLVLHPFEGETSYKIVHTASRGVINLKILLSADLTIDHRRVLRPTNKNFHKTITRRHLLWFVSPQPTKPIMNYQTSVR